MLSALVVTFREGLEAFLIIGIIAAYLKKTGRSRLIPGVWLGLGLAFVLSTCGGIALYKTAMGDGNINQPFWEGVFALVAAALVAVLLWQVQRLGRHLKGQIEARVDAFAGAADKPPSRAAFAAVAFITTLLVSRELAEVFFVLMARAMGGQAQAMVTGSVLGLGLAAGYALLWSRFGHRLNIGVVLKVTAVFLGLFLVQLIVWGIHELAESGAIAGSQAFHDATERLGPEGDIGGVFAFVVASVPLVIVGWSIVQMVLNKKQPPTPSPARS